MQVFMSDNIPTDIDEAQRNSIDAVHQNYDAMYGEPVAIYRWGGRAIIVPASEAIVVDADGTLHLFHNANETDTAVMS